MAISTSSNGVLLPGIETTIQDAATSAIDDNSLLSTILLNSSTATGLSAITTSVTAVQSKLETDVVTEKPYPTFSVYSNYNNGPAMMVYDSDMNPITGGVLQSDTQIQDGYRGRMYTNGGFGSGSAGASYYCMATPYNQADGHWLLNMPGSSYGNNHLFSFGVNPDEVNNTFPYFGVNIAEKGVRARYSLSMNGVNIGIYPRGGRSPLELLGLQSSTYATWANTNNQSWGMIGYNDRTRRLVVIEPKDGSNNYRMHVWRNTSVSLNHKNYTVGTLHTFLSEAKTASTPAATTTAKYYYYNDFTWQQDNSQNYNESRYRMMVTVGDNEYIGMTRFTPSNVTRYSTFLPNIAATTGLLETKNGVSHTTSYGIEQGGHYGIRNNITWDNNWVASYSPYYYYGSGMNVVFSEVADPRNYYTAQQGNTSMGCQLVPFREDKFIFNTSDSNNDGNVGARLYIVDLGGYKKFGRSPNGDTIVNGQGISLQYTTFTYSFDTRYTSTNYQVLLSPKSWTKG
jgi:hypothetical protein